MTASRRSFIAGLLSSAALPLLPMHVESKFSLRSVPDYVADGPMGHLEVLYGSLHIPPGWFPV